MNSQGFFDELSDSKLSKLTKIKFLKNHRMFNSVSFEHSTRFEKEKRRNISQLSCPTMIFGVLKTFFKNILLNIRV